MRRFAYGWTPRQSQAKDSPTRRSEGLNLDASVYDRCTIDAADEHFWHFMHLLECATYTL